MPIEYAPPAVRQSADLDDAHRAQVLRDVARIVKNCGEPLTIWSTTMLAFDVEDMYRLAQTMFPKVKDVKTPEELYFVLHRLAKDVQQNPPQSLAAE